MANEKQEIVLEIQVQGSIDNLAKLRSEMDTLIKTRQDLTDKSKAGDIEATKEIEKVNSAVRNMNMEYKAQQRVLDGYNKSQKEEFNFLDLKKNSIDQNTAKLKQLTAQYKSMQEPSAASTKAVNDLSKALNEQKLSIGDSTSNIGKYGQGFNEVTGKIVSLFPALEGLKTAQLGVNAAMEANPIGLVIVGVQALTSVIGSLQPVMDKIEQVTEAFSAGFGAFVNGGNILQAAGQAAKLTAELQDLQDAQNGVNIANSEADAAIAQLLLRLRNKNVTEKEGRVILEKLAEEDRNRLKQNEDYEQAIFDKKFARLKQQTNLEDYEIKALIERGQVRARLSEKELAQMIKDTGMTEAQLMEIDKKFRAKQEVIANDAEHKIVKDKEKVEAAIDELAQQQQKVIGIRTESGLLGEKIANREYQFNDRIDAEKLKRQSDINAEKDRLHKEEISQWQTAQSELDGLVAKSVEDEQAIYNNQIKNIIQGNAAIELLRTNSELQLKLQSETNMTRQQIDDDFAASSYKTFADYYAAMSALYKTDADNYKKEQAAKYNAASSIAGAFTALSNAVGQQTAAGIAFQKVATGIQIAIDTAKSISTAIAGATEAATAGGPAAPFLLVGYIATMIASVVGAVAQATQLLSSTSTPTPPKFAEGGKVIDIGGNYHSEGGTPIHVGGQYVAEAEKDEGLFIMKRTAYQAGKLSNWNQLFGGKSWGVTAGGYAAQGGMIIPTDGGFVARDIARNADNSALIQNAIKNGFALAPAPVLSIVEFQNKQNSRNRSINVSEA